jgi:membrane protein YdbS with pleckstrin-like domain
LHEPGIIRPNIHAPRTNHYHGGQTTRCLKFVSKPSAHDPTKASATDMSTTNTSAANTPTANTSAANSATFEPYQITRPAPALMRYYFFTSLLTGPLFPFVLIPLACKYSTLRYQFDDKGISMSWGVLFRREVVLTYRRIQDIHLTRGFIQRWFGLATVAIQTASGSAGAEMNIEGILAAEPLRDFLYTKMRGARQGTPGGKNDTAVTGMTATDATAIGTDVVAAAVGDDESLVLLREIRDSLTRLADRPTSDREVPQ